MMVILADGNGFVQCSVVCFIEISRKCL